MTGEPRADLRADCARCFGLCCVVPAFRASADFAITKPAGRPCPHLGADFGCGIHDALRPRGFPGCVVYDCFGAGQKVSQLTFGGRDWRQDADTARRMFDAFPLMRQLHELLWYLTEALTLEPARPLHSDLAQLRAETEDLTQGGPEALAALDLPAHRERVNALLLRTSELVRAQAPGRRRERRGADLIGARLKGADLRGANLRGAYLIGADLRDARLGGADLTDSIFLTQAQLNAAKGDRDTRLPAALDRPGHW